MAKKGLRGQTVTGIMAKILTLGSEIRIVLASPTLTDSVDIATFPNQTQFQSTTKKNVRCYCNYIIERKDLKKFRQQYGCLQYATRKILLVFRVSINLAIFSCLTNDRILIEWMLVLPKFQIKPQKLFGMALIVSALITLYT